MKTKLFVVVLFIMLGQSATMAQKQVKNPPKYIFVFIGDGMGLGHIALTQAYLSATENQIGFKQLTMTSFPVVGLATTHTKTRLITCSAAAGTALSTGTKTSPSTIAMTYDQKDTLWSISKYFKQQKFKVGIITSTFVNDATPSVFYAHSAKRSNLYDIALQYSQSNIDFIGGGKFAKDNKNDKNRDIYDILREKGFKVIGNKEDFVNYNDKNSRVVMYSPDCLNDGSIPFVLDQTSATIKLADFTQKAIDLLFNPNGFFLMVEGGKIDWAAHNNDAASIIAEVIDLDNAIKVAYNFYLKYPNQTLIVVTADHETGGLALGNGQRGYDSDLKQLQGQRGSISKFDDTLANFILKNGIENFTYQQMLDIAAFFFALDTLKISDKEKEKLKKSYQKFIENYKNKEIKETKYSKNPITAEILKIRNTNAGIDFTSDVHTAMPVPVFAIGVGAQEFVGYYDNTDIPKKIAQIAGLKNFQPIK